MAKLPEADRSVDPSTRVQTPQISSQRAGSEMTILGQGLDRGADALARMGEETYQTEQRIRNTKLHQQEVVQRLMKEKDAQLNAQAVNDGYSQLRKDWNTRLIHYQQDSNSPPDLMDVAGKEYDDYTKSLIDGMKTDVAKREMALHAASYKIELTNETYRIQSQKQLSAFGASFDKMMQNADDSIYMTKSAQELQVQKDLLNKTVDDAVRTKQIVDPHVAQNLREKVDLLGVSWAEANMSTNPEMVKDAIDSGLLEGVSSQHKYILYNKADESIKTKGNQEKILLNDALHSDIANRISTGEGTSLNIDRYGEINGPAAKDKAIRQLNNATALNKVFELSKGADGPTLNKLLEESKPTAGGDSPLYGEQDEYHKMVQVLVHQAQSDKSSDAFDYFANNPAIKSLDYRAVGLEDDKGYMRKQLQEAVLELQKADTAILPYEYQIMPKGEAEQFVQNFNKLTEVGSKTDGAGVLDVLTRFNNLYKDHMDIAVNQLNNTKGGDKVTPKMNPLLWHLRNPSTFRLIVDAMRKDPQEAYARFKSEKEINNFKSDAKQDPNFAQYQNSVLASNNSKDAQQLVSGTFEAWRDFSRDYVLNGGKISDASTVFFSTYSWGDHNGTRYARPKLYTDDMGQEHVMSDEQIRLSNGYIDFYPRTLDPATISPESILNQTSNFTANQLHSDVKNALANTVFWSTTEDETGVYLFTKGALSGTSRQVFHKDGTPVRLRFIDTMQSIPMVPYGEKVKTRTTPQTGDTWLDRLAASILSSG